jgi:molecular chaperone DnaJ
MNDPYKVLGVSQNASDEEVKAAYREMAKKYHPDSYANNPLADLAAEKMKEINEAYDTINKQRISGEGRSSQQTAGYGSAGSTYTGSAKYSTVRQMINQCRIAEAQAALNRILNSERDAEWHFLMGNVLYLKGLINEKDNTINNQRSSGGGHDSNENADYRSVDKSNSDSAKFSSVEQMISKGKIKA